jgi:hypothetical protein
VATAGSDHSGEEVEDQQDDEQCKHDTSPVQG